MGWTQRQINTFLFILILTGALVALISVLTRDAHPMTRIGYAVGALCAGGVVDCVSARMGVCAPRSGACDHAGGCILHQ